jgi:hypothetical protein
MKTSTRLLSAAIFALALPVAAAAQTPTPAPATPAAPASPTAAASPVKLEVGKWTGSVTPPGNDAMDIEFAVAAAGDTMKIDMTILAMGEAIPLSDVKVEATKVSFGFNVQGTAVTCSLAKKDDGSYAGECGDGGGNSAPMTMIPPKKGVPALF